MGGNIVVKNAHRQGGVIDYRFWFGLCWYFVFIGLGLDGFGLVPRVVLFPLSPPDQGLKIIVWLSRRWGLHLLREPAQATRQRWEGRFARTMEDVVFCWQHPSRSVWRVCFDSPMSICTTTSTRRF